MPPHPAAVCPAAEFKAEVKQPRPLQLARKCLWLDDPFGNAGKNWFFVGGQSAGAIAALTAAYLQNNDSSAFFRGFSSKLGPLDKAANDPAANNIKKSKVKKFIMLSHSTILTVFDKVFSIIP